MKLCQQTNNMSVYEHGLSVQNYTFDLLNHLRYNEQLKFKWLMPDWLYENKNYILDNIVNDDIIKKYTLYHDIGKPFCIEYDNDGKKHFPNHAKVSYDIYLECFINDNDKNIVSNLILHDMDIHILKSEDINNFMSLDNYLTLLIVGLCEIHSNAQMFGGINSTSFKIKYKKIVQRGKSIFNKIKIK